MKKTIFSLVALSILTLGAASCNQNRGDNPGLREEVFTGVLPAADALGVRYTLKLDFDDDHNYTDGDYDLVETYLYGDTLSATGTRDAASFKSEGDFTLEKNQNGKSYLKLVQNAKDSSAGSNGGPLYFLVDSDSTITMVNADLQPSETPGMNYTLKKAK